MTEVEKNQMIDDLIWSDPDAIIKDYWDILLDVEAIERDQENQDLLKKINNLRK